MGAGAAACCVMMLTAQSASNEPAKDEQGSTGSPQVERIARDVYKQIVTLPQYGVFDDIHFAIKGDSTVILRGDASRPILKSSAENVVKKIEGVRTGG